MRVAPLQTQLSFVFRGFCLILPPLSLLASHGVVALLMITAALAGLVVWRAERRLPLPDRALSLAFAALVIWCAIASFWGFTVTQSLVLALRIGAIFAAALVTFAIVRRLDAGVRDGLGAWLLAGILISLAIMVSERLFGYPFSGWFAELVSQKANLSARLNRGATAMAMMMWPAAALLWRRGAVAASLVFLAGAGAILSSLASGAAILGVAAGGATAILALLHRKAGRLVLVAATVVALAGTALAAKEMYRRDWQNADWLVISAQHRVQIWNHVAELVEQKPLTGWGFDAARAFKKDRVASEGGDRQLLPLHPHSAPLQVWLELGAIGVAIGAVLLLLLIRRIEKLSNPERVCSQALFVSTLAIACTAYGLWQNQWLAMMCAAALLVPLTSPALARPPASEAPVSGAPR
jgi:O-antigen ligase